jgi:hypothetical protein
MCRKPRFPHQEGMCRKPRFPHPHPHPHTSPIYNIQEYIQDLYLSNQDDSNIV